MRVLGALLILFLVVACPALCHVGAVVQTTCDSCPAQHSQVPADSCGDQPCLCSPYVMPSPKVSGTADVGLMDAAIEACCWDAAVEPLEQRQWLVADGPPEPRGFARSLPLLI